MVFRGRFQVLALAVLCAFLVAADVAMAQPGGRGSGGSMWGQVSQLNLLGQEAIQKELELVSAMLTFCLSCKKLRGMHAAAFFATGP